MTSIWKFK